MTACSEVSDLIDEYRSMAGCDPNVLFLTEEVLLRLESEMGEVPPTLFGAVIHDIDETRGGVA